MHKIAWEVQILMSNSGFEAKNLIHWKIDRYIEKWKFSKSKINLRIRKRVYYVQSKIIRIRKWKWKLKNLNISI